MSAFSPESGHVRCNEGCPLCANSGLTKGMPLSRISDLHTIAKAHGGSSEGRLVVASICFRFALRRRIEAVGNQIEQNPPVTESLTANSIEKSAFQSS